MQKCSEQECKKFMSTYTSIQSAKWAGLALAIVTFSSQSLRWISKAKFCTTEVSVQQIRPLCVTPLSINCVDRMMQGLSDKDVQLTHKLKTYRPIPSVSSWRNISIYSCNLCEKSSENRNERLHGKLVQSPTESATVRSGQSNNVDQQGDQPLDRNIIKSINRLAEARLMLQNPAPAKEESRPGRPQPPDPETCCQSGCVNCVWIKYVQDMQDYAPGDKEQVKIALDLIKDYNVKMFVKMELDL